MKKTTDQISKNSDSRKLSQTLKELEEALNKWDDISQSPIDVPLYSNEKISRDSILISETKKLLLKLKTQISELDQ